jgi:protocatechuate 3,4-dioxygenase alpha subunit
MAKLTPSQTIGPFFHDAIAVAPDLTTANPRGRRVVVEGRVLDGTGAMLPDALVEIWQANAAGRYDHPEDERADAPLDPGFKGFGRCQTDATGAFRFVTVKPGPVPGRGNAWQAPHISVSVFARGLLNRVCTRLYFADEAANDADPVLASVDPARRGTLIAVTTGPDTYRFDIRLQGDNETVFFAV